MTDSPKDDLVEKLAGMMGTDKVRRTCDPHQAKACAEAIAPALRELIEAMLEVRGCIKDAAMTGFNIHDGDWATRLFESQGRTRAALAQFEVK